MSGLEGVVVADTELSRVDGRQGELVLRGHRLEDLSDTPFEQVVGLLWQGELAPVALGPARQAAWAHLPEAMPHLDGMDALRAAIAALPPSDPADIVGAMAVFAAAWWRTQQRLPPIAPDPTLSHAHDLLRMCGQPIAEGLDTYLTAVVDHGLNASTFAARVVASTGSDDVSATVAALGALKGPLHGGAPGPVLDMLDAVGTPDQAEGWVRAELAAGRRIMGMGHRVYRVRDPRAAHLEAAVAGRTPADRLAVARAVERAAQTQLAARHPDRQLFANVEFYTALLLEALGFDRRMFTPVFAASRCVGWLAHTAEQRRNGRLLRPSSRYVGPVPL